MAAKNKRSQDELFAFLSLLSNDQQLKLKYFSLASREARRDFIGSLGFSPDLIRESLSTISITVGSNTTNLLEFLISKGVGEDTPLPVGIVLSALRSAGANSSFAPLEASLADFQSKLGSSAGGSAPQPRSIESVDPRDADRLVERDVVDNSRDLGLADFKDSAPSRELSRDSGNEFSALSRSKDDMFSSSGKFSSQPSGIRSTDDAYKLSRFDQHNDQLKSFSTQRSDLISSLLDRPSGEITRNDDRVSSETRNSNDRLDSRDQLLQSGSGTNSRDQSVLERLEASAKSAETIAQDKQENAQLSKELKNLQSQDPQLYNKYKEAMDSSDVDKFMSDLAKDLADAKISPQETIDLLHSFISDTLTRLSTDPAIPKDLLDRFVDKETKSLDEKEADLAALNEAAEKASEDKGSNDNNNSQKQGNDTSKWIGPTVTALGDMVKLYYKFGLRKSATAQWQQALKDAREGKNAESNDS